jgi:hypothetical protein
MNQPNPARRLVFALALFLLPQLGCYHNQPTPTSDDFPGSLGRVVDVLEKRAPHDLDCPPEQLTYKDLSGATVGVSGCDRRASYKWISGAGWVMDSAAQAPPQ